MLLKNCSINKSNKNNINNIINNNKNNNNVNNNKKNDNDDDDSFGEVNINRGIFQGDYFSPLLFVI